MRPRMASAIVGFTHIVTITTYNWHTANNIRQQLDARWPVLRDEGRIVQRDLDIKEYVDRQHDFMIPHIIVLRPSLIIHKVYDDYYFWAAASMAELHQDLREATYDIRADWDLTTPELKAAGKKGEKSRFSPDGSESMEHTLTEMAGAVDRYAGRAGEH